MSPADLIADLHALQLRGVTSAHLRRLHHFSLGNQSVTFQACIAYFEQRREIRGTNQAFASRCHDVAEGLTRGSDLEALLRAALARYPLAQADNQRSVAAPQKSAQLSLAPTDSSASPARRAAMPADQQIDGDLLTAFMRQFFGYGNLSAPLWFVGMEEGGGHTIGEIAARLDAWRSRGRRTVEDAADFHQFFGQGHWFADAGPVQTTWRRLIQIALVSMGRQPSAQSIAAFQRSDFGRSRCAFASLELFPLPSPGADSWLYDRWSKLEVLASRATYQRGLAPLRGQRLRKLIEHHKPKAVVFYGRSHREYWQQICGRELTSASLGAEADGVQYLLLPHPAARTSTAPFTEAGALLRKIGVHSGA